MNRKRVVVCLWVCACLTFVAMVVLTLRSDKPIDPGPMKVLEPELMIWSTKETMVLVAVPAVDPAAQIGSDLWWQQWWSRLDRWGIEQAAIGYESDETVCLFWARWRDGRELCVPPEPPSAGVVVSTPSELAKSRAEEIELTFPIPPELRDGVILSTPSSTSRENTCPAELVLDGCGSYGRNLSGPIFMIPHDVPKPR